VRDYLYEGEEIVIRYKGQGGRKAKLSGFAYARINRDIFRRILPYVTYFIVFGYGFDDSGNIITVDDSYILSAAENSGMDVLLSLSLIDRDGSFNTGKLDLLLGDKEFGNRVISGMIDEIRTKGAAGMDIDMEYVHPKYKAEFAEFVTNAASELHKYGLILNIDLAPKTSSSQAGTLYEAHDYAVLGNAADLAFLMSYEWGYQGGEPMPVAPINKVRQVVDYALTEIPADKIFMGMPNYAYDWTLPYVKGETFAEVIGNKTAADRASLVGAKIEFDETAQTPFYTYKDSVGREHIVWFEDVRSIKAKLQLIDESGIAGGGVWNFMRDFPQLYLMMNYMFALSK
jgi:spore germination protein